MKKSLSYLVLVLVCACNNEPKTSFMEHWKNEIRETEKAFADKVKQEGIHNAFLAFADENAVLLRNDSLILGKTSMDKYLENQTAKTLDWEPDFVEVSVSGDLGYTYGKYSFLFTDKEGNERKHEGIFHTVWKRQPDGTWKFVWD